MPDLSKIKLDNTVYNLKDSVAREAINEFDALPDQAGNSGKFLTTNGTTVSWASIPTAPVSSVNNQTGVVVLTASDVGALPSTTNIPTKVSDLTNDSGFISSYTETDPTVPAWAKAASKPSYTASEVGAVSASAPAAAITTADITNWNNKLSTAPVTSVNGQTGAVSLSIPTPTTVTQSLQSGTKVGEVNGTSLYAPATYDDTALANRVTALEAIPWVTYYSGSADPSSSLGTDGDIYFKYEEA